MSGAPMTLLMFQNLGESCILKEMEGYTNRWVS
jgi:hypothetical protein